MSVHSLPGLVKRDNDRRISRESRWRTLLQQEKRDLLSLSLWRGAFAEFVGTGLLCTFTIGFGMTPEGGTPPSILQIAISVGFFLSVIITALSNVSGAHVNPGISVAFFVTGHCTFVRLLIYSVFQCLGAVTGTGLLKYMAPSSHVGSLGLIQPGPGITDTQAMLAEGMITFLLTFATVAMIDPKRTDVHGSIPLIVGLTVSVNIFFANTISGGCMNPARAFGPAVITGRWNRLHIYWLGPLAGAVIGGLLYDVFFSAGKLQAKRWCSPLSYGPYGDPDDEDDDNGTDDGENVSDSMPLRNGKSTHAPIYRDENYETRI
ncbi:Aquaporin [Plakobranchus ocellatus]|uniref:Aquaporin n=1 Tax=Plakobranchus ocellatus TaxID=259542 RepID=A0AAV4BNG2_9GAST|nr:Aquaporin [Plakobranchus ocellatus]